MARSVKLSKKYGPKHSPEPGYIRLNPQENVAMMIDRWIISLGVPRILKGHLMKKLNNSKEKLEM